MNPLIIALDVESTDEAVRLIETIGPTVDFYKIGLELYAAGGMNFVERVSGLGKQVFLDLKLYDIGETVKRATRRICQSGHVHFLTVHASRQVMQAAVEGRGDSATRILAVTVLTSFGPEDLADLGYTIAVNELVEHLVQKAIEARVDGAVCSPLEVARVREIAGDRLKLVVPGSRSAGAAQGDQKRVATPREAVANGADYLVVGRQVTRAADPKLACEAILAEVSQSAITSSSAGS